MQLRTYNLMYVYNGNQKKKEKNKWMLNDQRSLIKEKKEVYHRTSIVFRKNIIVMFYSFIFTLYIYVKLYISRTNKLRKSQNILLLLNSDQI